MPEGYQDKFRRQVENSSELLYVRKMKSFYETTLQDLGRMLGEKTEFNVVVTMDVLSKVEERLSDFERKEKEIMKKYRNFSEAILV